MPIQSISAGLVRILRIMTTGDWKLRGNWLI